MALYTGVYFFPGHSVCRSDILFVMKINIWHSIEERTIYASIDQWHSRCKACI